MPAAPRRRLRATLRHMAAPAVVGVTAPVPAASADADALTTTTGERLKLLSDDAIKRWIVDGWLPLTVDELPRELHDTVHDKAAAMESQGLGNNVFPAIPEIGTVLSSATVRGALTSVLGPEFFTHAHRHLHSSGYGDQGWHKDSYWGVRRMRHHRPRWCMILYFPQDTTEDMVRCFLCACVSLSLLAPQPCIRACARGATGLTPHAATQLPHHCRRVRLAFSRAASTSPETTRERCKARISSTSGWMTAGWALTSSRSVTSACARRWLPWTPTSRSRR